MNGRVRVEIDGPVALVCLTRAEQHNGMDFRMLDAVRRAAAPPAEGPRGCAR